MSDNPTVPAPRAERREWILIFLLGAALAFQLVVPPIVGLADNGDFSRVASPLGIFPPEELGRTAFYQWIVPRYGFDPDRIWLRGLCCYSSQTTLALAALPVGLALAPPGRFDLRATGIVNGLALLGAVGLLLYALRPLPAGVRVGVGLFTIFVLSDVTYVSLFNSFYTEPAVLVFFVVALALALLLARSPNPPVWLVAAFFLVSILFATSRPQNALPGFFLAFLGWRLARYDRDHRRQRRLVGLAAVAVCLVVVAYSRSTPKLLRRIYLFNTVFRVMLPSSPDPQQDLAQLGLPPDFARLTGVWGFGPDAPVDDEDFQRIFGRVSYGKLAAFYLARPARLRSALEAGAPEAFQMRPYRLGNFARETGKPAGALSRSFSAWSRAKARFAPGRLWFVIAYLLVSLAAGIELRVRGRTRALRAAAEIWIVLVLLAAFQFGIASVMTGAESRRSFFLFNAVFDVTLAALIVRLADLVGRRRTALEPAI